MTDNQEFRVGKAFTVGLMDRANRSYVAAWSMMLEEYLGAPPSLSDWEEFVNMVYTVQSGDSYAPSQVPCMVHDAFSVSATYARAYRVFMSVVSRWATGVVFHSVPKEVSPEARLPDIQKAIRDNIRAARQDVLEAKQQESE